MKRRHRTPERIAHKLREAGRTLGEGTALVSVFKHLKFTEQTYYRRRAQYGGMKAEYARQLKELEKNNSRLTRIVADQALEIAMLKELTVETSGPSLPRGSGRSALAPFGLSRCFAGCAKDPAVHQLVPVFD